MNPFLWILFVAFPIVTFASERVRHVTTQKDQIITVRTAIGIATIIQVPDRPNSVVVGDQNAFKVEYLDQAITIKPLHRGAKSNLYVYTDWRRFNVQLITGSESKSDYVVYLDIQKEKPKEIKSKVHWVNISKELTDGLLKFKVKRVSKTKDSVLIDFEFQSTSKEKIDPSWIWVTQLGKTKPIHNLMLSNLETKENQKSKGMIQILKSDLDEFSSMKVELRRKKTAYLTLPKVNSWK